MKNEIVLYRPNEQAEHIEVRLEDETVWLNRQQISTQFGRDVKTIGKHINNVFSEGELQKESTVANFATIQIEGGRSVERILEHYNLDVIISVGYRVKSKRGIQFRIWATKVLKDYLLNGNTLNTRINKIEDKIFSLTNRIDEIDIQIKTSLPPNEGIFFDGQIFDAWVFVSELVKSATRSLILIDNYVDESVLNLFLKRKENVTVKIYTANFTPTLRTDFKKHNKQYSPIELRLLQNPKLSVI